MSVTITRDSDNKRIYRAIRIINKETVKKDFPCTRQGYIDAMKYDGELYEIQNQIRLEKTNEMIHDEKIKGFYFYTKIEDDLTKVKGWFSINRKCKEKHFTINRTIKKGEDIESVFHEMKMKYCELFMIDHTCPQVNSLFKRKLAKVKKEYNDVHETMFYQREQRRK